MCRIAAVPVLTGLLAEEEEEEDDEGCISAMSSCRCCGGTRPCCWWAWCSVMCDAVPWSPRGWLSKGMGLKVGFGGGRISVLLFLCKNRVIEEGKQLLRRR